MMRRSEQMSGRLSGTGSPVAVLGLLLAAMLGSSPIAAQSATVATDFELRYAEVRALAPLPDQSADVRGLVLKRDVATFTFENGRLWLLKPVGGRVVGMVFEGQGRFGLAPPSRLEQDRLQRLQKVRTMDAPFKRLVLLFADSTAAELEHRLTLGASKPLDDLQDAIDNALDFLGDKDSRSFDPDLMGSFLNGSSSDLFWAYVDRNEHGPVMFMLDPFETEGVSLAERMPGIGTRNITEGVSQFVPQSRGNVPVSTGDRSLQAEINHYTIEARLPQTGTGDLGFAAAAKFDIVADKPVGPWIAFWLFSKLQVDSARWADGSAAVCFKGKDGPFIWLRAPTPIQPGEVRTLSLYYHGDLIDRYGDFFFIKSSAAWYPRSLESRGLASFDLTFFSPINHPLASVGELKDSSTANRMVRTHWVSSGAIRNAGFNLGLFDVYHPPADSGPSVEVLISEDAHRMIARAMAEQYQVLQQKNMREMVGRDVTKSLRFFQTVYGEAPVGHFYATEIPGNHGEAFPGLIHLSWWTFQQTDDKGEDEIFRSHEVAHQWWGIAVDFASYHDQWLSEGFSDFSGLWYLQTVRKNNDKYLDALRRWRDLILERADEAGPIWLGYRTATSEHPRDYDIIVYKKGAWVLHMLRILMLDVKTMKEDRFTGMMQDFYRTYRGKRASTEDFKRIVEQHTGADMTWFFNEWVYGSAIPRYRVSWHSEAAEGGKYKVQLRVQQSNVPDDFEMYVPVTVDFGGDRLARLRLKVKGATSTLDLPLLDQKPKAVRFNDLEGVLAEVKEVPWE